MIDIYTEKKESSNWILKNDHYFNLTRISKNSPTSIGGEMNCHLLHSAIVGM